MNADKKIIIFLSFCLAFELALGWNFFAESKTIVLGGKTGWPELSSKEGVKKTNIYERRDDPAPEPESVAE